jgi:hypothetical protein
MKRKKQTKKSEPKEPVIQDELEPLPEPKKKVTKNSPPADVYDKIQKAREKKVDDDYNDDTDYEDSDDENVKFEIVQMNPPTQVQPEIPTPEPLPIPALVPSREVETKKTRKSKSTSNIGNEVAQPSPMIFEKMRNDLQLTFKQEQQKLKSLYDNQFKLLQEENNKLRNLNDYQTHLQRLTHMSKNVKVKF